MMRNLAALPAAPQPPAATSDFASAMRACLESSPHEISPKYFYDATGSILFEQICALPEYYVTRTELQIFERDIHRMAALIGPAADVVEFGAGSLIKARLLLKALKEPHRFIAIDLSAQHLFASAAQLQGEFPAVEIIPLVEDFSAPERLAERLPALQGGRRIGFFPGSTLGNFSPAEARHFLQTAARLLAGGGLLIGIDLVKSPLQLHQAYNDAAGITAAFNRNLLVRANRELGSNFNIAEFIHHACYRPDRQRVEMHLICSEPQLVRLGAAQFQLRQGDSLHTENSQKYTIEGFQALAEAAGFLPQAVWCDPERLFSVHWLKSRF